MRLLFSFSFIKAKNIVCKRPVGSVFLPNSVVEIGESELPVGVIIAVKGCLSINYPDIDRRPVQGLLSFTQ